MGMALAATGRARFVPCKRPADMFLLPNTRPPIPSASTHTARRLRTVMFVVLLHHVHMHLA